MTRRFVVVGALAIALGFALLEAFATVYGPYGYFIDELYYLACAKRLDWGYVDHPPLSIAVLRLTTAVFGTSTLAIRIPAILALAATVVLAARIAKRFGGGAFAQTLAALATTAAPFALVYASFSSMNAFEALLWPLVVLLLVSIADGDSPRRWVLLGLLLGLGLENKHTTVVFIIAVFAGLVVTPMRTHLATRWPWLAAALAAFLLVPNLLWQRAHGFPSLEFYAQAQALKNVPTPPLDGIANQFRIAGPGAFFLWTIGAGWLLTNPRAKAWRFVGVTFIVLFVLMIVSRSSRPDRIAAIYPVLFAAGAVAIEAFTRDRRRWLRGGAVILVVAGAALVIPIAVPLFGYDSVARYANAVGLMPQLERGKTSPLPQPLADRTGWVELVDDVERVYLSLPPEEREHAVVLASSYGPAGAVELLGAPRGLPRVIGLQNNYWLWGPGDPAPTVVIAVGVGRSKLDVLFESHELAATHACTYCMSWRNGLEVRVARRPRQSLVDAWSKMKDFQ